MLVSLNWLKEFVETDKTAFEIAEHLTMGGIEVESVNHVGGGLNGVFTAKILEKSPHPAVDKLCIVKVVLSDRTEEVVCGAPNVQVGDITAFAAVGAELPCGITVSVRQIKGIESKGMLCSEKELGLGEDASGILILEPGTPVGLPLTATLNYIDDFILETSVTPNRGDCLSILGVARELAALINARCKKPQFEIIESEDAIDTKLEIELWDPQLCPRYVARMVKGVRIAPSPFELRLKLFRHGVRPISNVVDVTNLVLLECGQPLHAFDHHRLEGGKIVVRRCTDGETFFTLDGIERNLPKNSLMICDAKRSVALAGIMGGQNSEIENFTKDVVIESACFERFGIRRTAKSLGMSTEASFRFERGTDPEGALWAANRASFLMQRIAGGEVLRGVVDAYPNPIIRPRVTVRNRRVSSLVGVDFRKEEIIHYLERLDIKCESCGESEESLICQSPSWRWDLEREVDMAEEVARIHGFQRIPVSMPVGRVKSDQSRTLNNRVRLAAKFMTASGFTEIVSMSFIPENACIDLGLLTEHDSQLKLINPLTEDYSVMRRSLLPGLMSALKRNLNFKIESIRLFEIGKVFVPVDGSELPREDLVLSGIAVGPRYSNNWHYNRGEINTYGKVETRPETDFYDLKGAIENCLEGLGCEDVKFIRSDKAFLHPGKSANLLANGLVQGFVGELNPKKTREFGLTCKIQVFEILLEPFLLEYRKKIAFRPLPRYPFVERDLSVVVETNCSGDDIKHLISRLGHGIINSVILFDLYRGESIPEGYQSMAFRIRYQSEDRTLTDAEVQEVHSQVIESLAERFGASVRD
ncbi:MAG: phenylalanine--tRNA ligase subunit beta [Syntrophaceae bacterium]|nr:phenylalanine--tRNA ligase subunit beta [Syntrophaceae bacterium]